MADDSMTNASNTPRPLCSMCPKPRTGRCKRCQCSRYCSRECQRYDWEGYNKNYPVHKSLCKTFKNFGLFEAPSPDHWRCIYCPENEKTPRFVWVQPDDIVPATNMNSAHGIGKPWIKDPVLDRSHAPINVIARNKLAVGEDPSGQNRSLLKLGLGKFFTGPILFYRPQGHLDMTDWRYIVDNLNYKVTLWYQAFQNGSLIRGRGTAAVRINCKGDEEIMGRDTFENTKFDPDFVREEIKDVPIGDLVGIPLQMFRLANALAWRDRLLDGLAPQSNIHHQQFHPTAWRMGSMEGSVVVVRKDRKILDSVHIRALRDYVQQVYDEGLKFTVVYYGHPESNQPLYDEMVKELLRVMRKNCTKEGFEKFYNKWIEEKGIHGIPSPYDC